MLENHQSLNENAIYHFILDFDKRFFVIYGSR